MTHTCVERCVGKQEGGRVEVGIESPVVRAKQRVHPPPAARGELEKVVPYAVSYRVRSAKGIPGILYSGVWR